MAEAKKNGKIVLETNRYRYRKVGEGASIKVGYIAYNILVDIANETGLPLKRIAHEIITQSYKQGLITFIQKEGDEYAENKVVDSK